MRPVMALRWRRAQARPRLARFGHRSCSGPLAHLGNAMLPVRSEAPAGRDRPVGASRDDCWVMAGSGCTSIAPSAGIGWCRVLDAWLSRGRVTQSRCAASMKTTTIPSIRVGPDFRAEVEAVPGEEETRSQFVEASVRASVERRRMQAEFIARGPRSRDEARRTGDCVDAGEVIDGLQRRRAATCPRTCCSMGGRSAWPPGADRGT